MKKMKLKETNDNSNLSDVFMDVYDMKRMKNIENKLRDY